MLTESGTHAVCLMAAAVNCIADGAGRMFVGDGHKTAALLAHVLKDLITELPASFRPIQMGVILTAYANGACTDYIERVLNVVCIKTGVTQLHQEAAKFDIGIYFEANGRGTVLYAPWLLQRLREMLRSSEAARWLLGISKHANQAVGDVESGFLLIQTAISLKGWSLGDWQGIYQDLPSRHREVAVKDRPVLVSLDPAAWRVTAPAGLQQRIDQLVQAAGTQARAFARASSTQNIVRVYAEATTQEAADTLTLQIMQAVHELVDGVGPRPER